MARNTNIFIREADKDNEYFSGFPVKDGYNDTYATGVNTRLSDLRFGGQFGYSPYMSTWTNFHPYVSRNVIPILLEPPRGFLALPDSKTWIGAIRSMFEVLPLSITGLNAQLDVSTADTEFGGGGQVFTSYTNVKEVKSDLQIEYVERKGLPIYRLLSAWIRYLMMDPNTKNATINTIPGVKLSDLMADQYSATVLFIEPDELQTTVTQSWLGVNIWPQTTGANTAKRDKANDMEKRNIQIKFSGIFQYGAGVDDFAQRVLNSIDLTGADPHARATHIDKIETYFQDYVGEGFESTTEGLEPINKILRPGDNGLYDHQTSAANPQPRAGNKPVSGTSAAIRNDNDNNP